MELKMYPLTAAVLALLAEGLISRHPTSQGNFIVNQPRWTAANDTRKPPSGKDRSKTKVARKQRTKK